MFMAHPPDASIGCEKLPEKGLNFHKGHVAMAVQPFMSFRQFKGVSEAVTPMQWAHIALMAKTREFGFFWLVMMGLYLLLI
jgi:hypothetical protein